MESVLGQTYPRVQYLVIDGASSDESVAILRSYGNRLEWLSEPDLGQTHAINKGMARARGEVLGYLNSDDVLLPGSLERVVRYFEEHPDCDMVYGNADYIDEDDRVTGAYRTADYSFERLMQDCMVCQPAAFWRRRIADKVGPFNQELNYAMDYDYWLRIARAGGKIHFLREKLACSRRYPETKTLSARAEIHREIFRVCWQNAGYVHPNFFLGYWHHLIHERKNALSRVLRYVPRLYRILGWLHHRWYHFERYSRRQLEAGARGKGG
jgi:glycosyltransferase involved in cell wall biosynthesis